jgi:hypothetical protein
MGLSRKAGPSTVAPRCELSAPSVEQARKQCSPRSAAYVRSRSPCLRPPDRASPLPFCSQNRTLVDAPERQLPGDGRMRRRSADPGRWTRRSASSPASLPDPRDCNDQVSTTDRTIPRLTGTNRARARLGSGRSPGRLMAGVEVSPLKSLQVALLLTAVVDIGVGLASKPAVPVRAKLIIRRPA